ncbi:MAG: ATP-binding protein [Candidatus Omnitrophota bacterium]
MFSSHYRTIQQSIRLKIWIAIQITTLAILCLFFFIHFVIEAKTTNAIVEQQGRLQALGIINDSFHQMENLKENESAHFIQPNNLPQEVLSLDIADNNHIIRFSNLPDRLGAEVMIQQKQEEPKYRNPRENDAWRTRVEKGELILTTSLKNENRCQRCHTADPAILGYAEVRLTIRDINQVFWNAQWYHMGATVSLFFGFSVIILYMTRRLFLRRIGVLASAMRKISQGDFKTELHDGALDEIGELSRSFNTMVEEISAARKKEEEQHRQEIHQFDRLAAIGELAGGLAHEIRNPIAGIRAAIQTLSRNIPSSDPTALVYQEIRTNADRLDALVRSLLSYVRKEKPQLAPTQINGVIEQSLTIFRNQCSRDITIRENLASDLPPIPGDAKLLQQVLLNIFINALQAKENGLELTVESKLIDRKAAVHEAANIVQDRPFRCQNQVIQIRIRDNGPGIPEQDILRIFQPFVSTKKQGTGLGLSISTRIVREHNGCLFALNNEGIGSTFVVCLPVKSDLDPIS